MLRGICYNASTNPSNFGAKYDIHIDTDKKILLGSKMDRFYMTQDGVLFIVQVRSEKKYGLKSPAK